MSPHCAFAEADAQPGLVSPPVAEDAATAVPPRQTTGAAVRGRIFRRLALRAGLLASVLLVGLFAFPASSGVRIARHGAAVALCRPRNVFGRHGADHGSADRGVENRRLIKERLTKSGRGERRYSRLRRRAAFRTVRWSRAAREAFFQYQYADAAGFIDAMPGRLDLSGIAADGAGAGSINGNGILLDSMTFAGVMQDVLFNEIGRVSLDKDALALSGGSAGETSRVSMSGDGALQLSLAPNWSFVAKFDGELAPQPQVYAGSGTLQYRW